MADERREELIGQIRMRTNSLRLDVQAFQAEFPGHGDELAMLAEVNSVLRQVHLTMVGEGEGDEIPVIVDDRFVLFDVFEVSRENWVGRTALCMAWTDNDVVVELRARGYPFAPGDRATFVGWPSDENFRIVREREGQERAFLFRSA